MLLRRKGCGVPHVLRGRGLVGLLQRLVLAADSRLRLGRGFWLSVVLRVGSGFWGVFVSGGLGLDVPDVGRGRGGADLHGRVLVSGALGVEVRGGKGLLRGGVVRLSGADLRLAPVVASSLARVLGFGQLGPEHSEPVLVVSHSSTAITG
jgi:hypothetical protein